MSADTFRTATWNPFNQTPRREVEPILGDLLGRGVSLLLIQESQADYWPDLLRDAELESYHVRPQWRVAWRPDLWVKVNQEPVDLAPEGYFTKSGHLMRVLGASVILCDRLGRSLEAMSYHLPAHVQVANKPPRRIAATRAAMVAMGNRAKASETRAQLYGGDDNVDETKAKGGPWGFMLKRATGMEQVQAPRPTHGRTRKIDDFRTRGLTAGNGWTQDGGGDHRIHGRVFRWV